MASGRDMAAAIRRIEPDPPPLRTYTLRAEVDDSLAPRQTQELILAQEIGTLTLALRSTLDEGMAADLGSLDPLGLLKVPIPPIPKPRPWWRELRGPS